MLVSSSAANPNLPTCLCCTDPQITQPLQLGELLSTHWLASPIGTPLFRCFDPLCLPLSSQVGLELCEHPKHVEEGLTSSVARIDGLLGRFEVHAALLQIMDDVLQVTKRTREPINAGDDEGVATSDELEGSIELLSSLPSGSTCLFIEHFLAASGC